MKKLYAKYTTQTRYNTDSINVKKTEQRTRNIRLRDVSSTRFTDLPRPACTWFRAGFLCFIHERTPEARYGEC